MSEIIINLAVEDDLSEIILRQMLKQSQNNFIVGTCLKRQGYGYLKRIISGLNKAASGSLYLVLTDLDQAKCPLEIINSWLKSPKHPNLLFRIAVKEVEAWLLADRESFAKFLGISITLIPTEVDLITDPKQCLINLTRKSKKRDLKEGIIPDSNSTAKIGKDYNGILSNYVQNYWQVESARLNSPSLKRAMIALNSLS